MNCPDTLEIRHLLNFKELTNDIRSEIIDGINKYGEYVTRQQDEQENLKKIDERNDEEKLLAQRIKEKVRIRCSIMSFGRSWLLFFIFMSYFEIFHKSWKSVSTKYKFIVDFFTCLWD